MKVLMVLVAIIVGINVVGFVVNSILSKDELSSIEPYGQLVDVDGSKMHVYSMGNGEETIVLLPGWGVALPSADFAPLMRKLSEDYTVVTVEYFGIGFSDQSATPRTNENYTEEIRTALNQAGFEAPYVLMPHSASGIYSEYYAAKYPEEVAAIIMLDTTSTARIEEMPGYLRLVYSAAKLQQATGALRLNARLIPDTKLVENGYTEKEKLEYRLFSYHVINDTIIDQALFFMDNIKEVNRMEFPKDMPVLKLISEQSVAAMAKKDKDDGMGYQNAHLSRLGEHVEHRLMDASHFVYQTKAGEIAALTREFLVRR